MTKKLLHHGINGMFVGVFLLHALLLIKSIQEGTLMMILPNKLDMNLLNSYIYQFAATAWTGFITPIAFLLLDDMKLDDRLKIFINCILLFTAYFLWASFIYSLSLSPVSFLALFGSFVIMDYWVIYILQYMALKKKISYVNNKINKIGSSVFLREGGGINDIKYPQ